MTTQGDLTRVLQQAQVGDTAAVNALFESTYPVLRGLARARLRAHARTPTLDTSSLVHEVFVRFVSAGRLRIEDSLHFRRWVSTVMRSVIVDLARKRLADRRGGGAVPITLTADAVIDVADDQTLIIRVHDALTAFAEIDARAAHIVEMRFFAGMTEAEVAAALGVAERTVRRDWDRARLMLREMLA